MGNSFRVDSGEATDFDVEGGATYFLSDGGYNVEFEV